MKWKLWLLRLAKVICDMVFFSGIVGAALCWLLCFRQAGFAL